MDNSIYELHPSILTRSGTYFDFFAPEKHVFTICELAASLSKLCRYTGHTTQFYSVAQHAVLVSYIVPAEQALAGLLHDASEAYLGDVSSPLKQLLPAYQEIETRVEEAIFRQFNLPLRVSPDVKHADRVALMTEQRDLMPEHSDVWFNGKFKALPHSIEALPPAEAEQQFIARFDEILLPAPELLISGYTPMSALRAYR